MQLMSLSKVPRRNSGLLVFWFLCSTILRNFWCSITGLTDVCSAWDVFLFIFVLNLATLFFYWHTWLTEAMSLDRLHILKLKTVSDNLAFHAISYWASIFSGRYILCVTSLADELEHNPRISKHSWRITLLSPCKRNYLPNLIISTRTFGQWDS